MDIITFNHHIWDLMRSIAHGIDNTLRVIVDGFGVTMVQMRVLVELKHCQMCTIGDLAEAMGSAPGNASAMCKTLEKKGLVTRTRNPEDERIVLVNLTDQGTGLLQDIEKELTAKCDPLLAEYSDEDFEQILLGLGKLEEVITSLHHAFDTNQRRR
jgi:DNA-binding MarR family transcriptional regulator